jgi:hypothetical protein
MKKLLYLFLFLIPILSFSQGIKTDLITRPSGNSPVINKSVSSLSGYIVNFGSNSNSQFYTVTCTNLIANVTITPSAGVDISFDNSTWSSSALTAIRSGGTLTNEPVVVYVRINSTAAAGNFNGTVVMTSTNATSQTVNIVGTVNSLTPSLTTTGTLNDFSTPTGTASTPQNINVSGQNLTTGATVTAPTGFEVSLDNSNYATSKNISQAGGSLIGQPVVLYVRVAAATSAGSYSGNINIVAGTASKAVAVTATVSSGGGGGGGTEAKFMFGKDNNMLSEAGWTRVFGDPGTAISVTDQATGWTIETIPANWQAFAGGNYASNNFGALTGTFGTEFPKNTVAGSFLNSGIAYNSSSPNYGLKIANLSPGSYTMEWLGSVQSAVSNVVTTPDYRVAVGLNDGTVKRTMNNQDNTGSPVDATHVLTFTFTITLGDVFYMGVFAGPGFVPGGGSCNAIRIKKN